MAYIIKENAYVAKEYRDSNLTLIIYWVLALIVFAYGIYEIKIMDAKIQMTHNNQTVFSELAQSVKARHASSDKETIAQNERDEKTMFGIKILP